MKIEMEVGCGSGGSRKWVGQRGSWVSFLPKAVGHGGSRKWVGQRGLWVSFLPKAVGHGGSWVT